MRALLDANVLFPTILREILSDLGAAGLFLPFWSARIIEEWVRAAAKLGSGQDAIARLEAEGMIRRFPGAQISVGDEASLGVQLPDAADLHVLRAAVDAEAEVIVTANLRDFPRRTLGFYGLRAEHPDEFLLKLARREPSTVLEAVEGALLRARQAGGDLTRREMLSRSRLPRLQKYLSRLTEGSGTSDQGERWVDDSANKG